MDFSDWFDFNSRVKQDMTLEKKVDGRTVTKQVRGSFNWLAFIFTFFYALFSQKYKTQGFLKKVAGPFVALLIVNFIVAVILGGSIGFIVNVAGVIWYGLMFDTWFKNQLIVNGYHVDESLHSESHEKQHDVE